MARGISKQLADTSTRETILERSIPLFARAGFDGVAMRDIAAAVGISAAALYYHFDNKEALYLETMALAFADKAQGISAALATPGSTIERLTRFVGGFTQLMAADPNFRTLLHRELLDGDETRLRLLAKHVFKAPFLAIADLAAEAAPGCDAHLLAISIAGLILFHFETAPLRRFLPGCRPEHEQPEVIAAHILELLMNGVGNRSTAASKPKAKRKSA